MSIYVLDTDTCIYWLNGKEPIRQHIQKVGVHHLRVTMITVAELKYGA